MKQDHKDVTQLILECSVNTNIQSIPHGFHFRPNPMAPSPSLSPDTHPRHRRFRSSPEHLVGVFQASLASPTLETFPIPVPRHNPPLSAQTPSPKSPFSTHPDPPETIQISGIDSSTAASICLSPRLDSRFVTLRPQDPSKSSTLQDLPATAPLGALRLYSEVLAAPAPIPLAASSKSQQELSPPKIRSLAGRLNFPAAQPCSSVTERLNPVNLTDPDVGSQGAAPKDLRILKSGRKVQMPAQILSAVQHPRGSLDVSGSEWQEVKANRWRRSPAHSPDSTNQFQLQLSRARFLKHMEGKCFRCLRSDHRVIECREPLRCWFCMGIGHCASSCLKRKSFKSTATSQPLPQTSVESFPPLAPIRFPPKLLPRSALSSPSSMDDLSARPSQEPVVISATGEIERLRQKFSARSIVAWQVGHQGSNVDPNVFADDVHSAFRIRRSDIQITKFHPEDFFITCSSQNDRDAILRQPRLATKSGRVYLFCPWEEGLHGVPARFRYRARVCIEGIPMHARTEETAAKIIGRKCSINYVEEYSRRQNYNRTFDIWIWTDAPKFIPRSSTFSITNADEEGLPTDISLLDLEPHHNPPPDEPKEGWTYDILVHIDTLEDLHSKVARAYDWQYGAETDGVRFREFPLPCRREPDPKRGPDDEDEDREQRSQG